MGQRGLRMEAGGCRHGPPDFAIAQFGASAEGSQVVG